MSVNFYQSSAPYRITYIVTSVRRSHLTQKWRRSWRNYLLFWNQKVYYLLKMSLLHPLLIQLRLIHTLIQYKENLPVEFMHLAECYQILHDIASHGENLLLWVHRLLQFHLAAESLVRLQVSRCEICDGKSGTRTGFSPNTSVSPFNKHSTNAPKEMFFRKLESMTKKRNVIFFSSPRS
jgi:hypothetical protein